MVVSAVLAPRARDRALAGRHRRSFAAAFLLSIALTVSAPHGALAETIEAALAHAYENNPQLNAQRAIVRQTDETVAQALSGYRPTLSANASIGRQYTSTRQVIPPTPPILPAGAAFNAHGLTTPRSVGINATQTLLNGEQTANKVREAESQVSAARETLRVMEQSVLLAAATVYMDVSRDAANLEVQQNNFHVLERMLKDTRQRFDVGQITTTDVAQAEAQLAAGEASLHGAESTVMTTRANYRCIIGHDRPDQSRSRFHGRSTSPRQRYPPPLPSAAHKIHPSRPLCTASTLRNCRSRLPRERYGRP